MRTFTLTIDEKLESTLKNLKVEFGETLKVETIRLGVAVLSVIARERKNGFRAVLIKEDALKKEFVF